MSNWTIITGGCGYIGSHIAAQIKKTTDGSVVIVDPRANELTHTLKWCDTYISERCDSQVALEAMMSYRPTTLIHCVMPFFTAVDIDYDPMILWKKEITGFISMLHTAAMSGVSRVILLGSASVYDESAYPVTENCRVLPRDVMASMQLAAEQMLADCFRGYGINSVSLRLSNVAGADPGDYLGELYGRPTVSSMLIDSVINGVPFDVHGNDWPTGDSTPSRDYVHVSDVARAATLADGFMKEVPGAHVMNISGGQGKTVQELIDIAEMMFNKQVSYRYLDRRKGDVASVVVSNQKAQNLLDWQPKYTINDMLKDTFKWQSSHVFNSLKSLKIHHQWNPQR